MAFTPNDSQPDEFKAMATLKRLEEALDSDEDLVVHCANGKWFANWFERHTPEASVFEADSLEVLLDKIEEYNDVHLVK